MIHIDFSEEIIEVRSEPRVDPLARIRTCSMGDILDSAVFRPRGAPLSSTISAGTPIREAAAATSRGNLGGNNMRVCDRDLSEEGLYHVLTAFRRGRQLREVQFELDVVPREDAMIVRLVVDPSSSTGYWILNDEPVRHERGVGFAHEFRLDLEVNERLGTIIVPEVTRKTMWDRLDDEEDE